MLNNNEIWVKCTPIHEISNLGNLRNISSKKLLKLRKGTTGYLETKIRNFKGKKFYHLKIHRLVALYFLPNPFMKKEVNHIDGNKLNNRVDNLEWVSHKENMIHASKINLISKKPRTLGKKLGKTSKYFNVSWDKTRNKWYAKITINKKIIEPKRFDSEEEAALYVNYLIDKYESKQTKNII